MARSFYRLDGGTQSMVWMSVDQAMPQLLYWGATLAVDEDFHALALAQQQPLPHGGLDVEEVVSWLPEPGRGFTAAPGLELRRGERRLFTQFHLKCATATASGWCFELEDAQAAIALQLSLCIDPASGVLGADLRLHNVGADPLSVDHLATLVLPVPGHLSEQLSTGGRWTQEFQVRRERVGSAGWLQESRVGRTSHHAWPGLVLCTAAADAAQGEAWSVQLAWSGNHRVLLQNCRPGSLQLQAGELLLPGEVTLAAGASHSAPTLHLARSDNGLRELSRRWQQFVRHKVLPAPRSSPTRPVHFNTWEATYFDHDEARLRALADSAAAVGVERFILDDGWFAGRRHDRAGLGDWWPCPERYPQGLAPLAQHCKRLGMQFGLWVEPEGLSSDSDLFRAHPDWVLGVPGLQQPMGRHQWVLDLGRPEVRGHLFDALSRLLRSAPISYLKWDMNRDMTHAAGADGHSGVRHHVMGLYALLDRLLAVFPQLEIETCASGGARADLAMLRRCSRVWASDCNDPLERQGIQQGLLNWLPPEVIGSHVGDARSHTTGRQAGIGVRTLAALLGHFGIEADLLAMAAADREFLAQAVLVYKAERGWLHNAHVSAIDTIDPALKATLALAADGVQGLLSVVAVARPATAVCGPLRVPHLEEGARYRVTLHPLWPADARAGKAPTPLGGGAALVLSGGLLMRAGLALPLLAPGEGLLLRLARTSGG